jgi:hypothetical protein
MDVQEEDREFLGEAIGKIASLYSKENTDPIIGESVSIMKYYDSRYFSSENRDEIEKRNADYERRLPLLIALLKAKKPVKWVAGWGVGHAHANVYETNLAGVILRMSFEMPPNNGATIFVERNSSYQAKQEGD